ncbi:ParA family protein [Xanthomonas oryzae]|uniref:ParA family protein n=1 Tax=Xanthomonas oryzae TaxID=347 RepID=UPI000B90AB9B
MTERYVVWNNKGGVGKSTITFHVASRYAELNPEKQVLVIDLCPQAKEPLNNAPQMRDTICSE